MLLYFGVMLTRIDFCRIPVTPNRWKKLEGSFSLADMPNRIVFFLEGPPPGVDLLINSVILSSSVPKQFEVSICLLIYFSSLLFLCTY